MASAVIETSGLPYFSVPRSSVDRNDEPAYASSMPSTRSSSMGWPIDSWTWSSTWPLSRISVVTSLGHSGADSSSTASRPVRSASSIRPSVRTCSQPAALMWPRNEFGYDRRCTSPSAMAVASNPPPECTTT